MDRHIAAFREEAAELFRELEGSLLELEERPDDAELIGRVFRALHTIKGSGAMFGFTALAAFTHHVETVFDGVRDGHIAVSGELIGVTLAARDHIQTLLSGAQDGVEAADSAGEEILNRLRAVVTRGVPAPAPVEQTTTWRLHFEPAVDILLTGANPLLLFRELYELGQCSLMAHVDRIPDLEECDPAQCYTYWDAVLTTTAGENAIRDVFIFVEDRARLVLQAVETDLTPDAKEPPAAPRVGELLVEAGAVSRDRVEAALLEQQHLGALREKRQRVEAGSTLRCRPRSWIAWSTLSASWLPCRRGSRRTPWSRAMPRSPLLRAKSSGSPRPYARAP